MKPYCSFSSLKNRSFKFISFSFYISSHTQMTYNRNWESQMMFVSWMIFYLPYVGVRWWEDSKIFSSYLNMEHVWLCKAAIKLTPAIFCHTRNIILLWKYFICIQLPTRLEEEQFVNKTKNQLVAWHLLAMASPII